MVRLFDNTLRDGGNVVGHGFPIALTESIVQALLSCSIADIECGNCKGLGAYDKLGATQAPSDAEYFSALQPYLPQGHIGKARGQRACPPRRGRGAALPARRRERR